MDKLTTENIIKTICNKLKYNMHIKAESLCECYNKMNDHG